jgi:hypothetical protein
MFQFYMRGKSGHYRANHRYALPNPVVFSHSQHIVVLFYGSLPPGSPLGGWYRRTTASSHPAVDSPLGMIDLNPLVLILILQLVSILMRSILL